MVSTVVRQNFSPRSRWLSACRLCIELGVSLTTMLMGYCFCSFLSSYDGLMAVTDFIDDEKPLYVNTDEDLNITAFADSPTAESRYISGGIYGLQDNALDILDECMASGIERMRNFQRSLVKGGLHLKAHPFNKIIDIDHAEDIAKAEEFLAR